MEESIDSSLCSSCSTVAAGSAAPEESGWTAYLEDFMAAISREKPLPVSSSGGSSMISDAASCVPHRPSEEYKQLDDNDKEEEEDDSLQDTASSPAATHESQPMLPNFNPATLSEKLFPSHVFLEQVTKNKDIYRREEDVGCRKDQELKKTLDGIQFVDRTNECASFITLSRLS